jgi:hypothetical protein
VVGVSAAVVSSGDGGRSELAEVLSAVLARVAPVAILEYHAYRVTSAVGESRAPAA